MFNFIICDNDSFFLQQLKKFISTNTEYESIRVFNGYTNAFFKIANNESIKNKFYIVDIETELQNGIIVASKIRNFDRNSIIVFITEHEKKYLHRVAKSCFRYDALINKFDDFQKELLQIIENNKRFIETNRRITITVDSHTTCIIDLDELLYIQTSKVSQKLLFQTKKQTFTTYESLSKFERQLNDKFIKVSRSCIINKQLAKFDYQNNIIKFNNNIKLENVMSQSYIKKNL